jgi:hypothetical protein
MEESSERRAMLAMLVMVEPWAQRHCSSLTMFDAEITVSKNI